VFSRSGLDRGTEILLNALPEGIRGRVLDMGCGYGALGLSIKAANPACELTMADINERAVALARENARANRLGAQMVISDGFSALRGKTYDLIALNPPIRAGKKVIYGMFPDAGASLADGGALYVVIRKKQGAPSARVYLETLFAAVETVERSLGYHVLRCTSPAARNEADKENEESRAKGT
jgi:16S rRNA (guanine1207-N2)-methyltransferase